MAGCTIKFIVVATLVLPGYSQLMYDAIFGDKNSDSQQISSSDKSFGIDYDNDTFELDGQPYRYIAGTIHYYQVPHKYWRDRLIKLRAAGCNALETYLAWNYHEPEKGKFAWTGDQDIEAYLATAHELGLQVILRLGPYMDAEQDMGGLPAWLLKQPDIKLRQTDEHYQKAVQDFYEVALAKLKPLLWPNGGPIIMVQVENEYGSYYACDRDYTHWLMTLAKKLLDTDKIVYFTTDGGAEGYLKCGVINGTYPTVDFGTGNKQGVAGSFAAQRKYAPKGPLVNSEFYPGWFDMWGAKTKSSVSIQPVLDTMTYMYEMGASFNLYPFHGGTNWGYQAGAEAYPDGFGTVTTSYDFDAPVSEDGSLTPKWFAIRQHIEKLTGKPNKWPIPPYSELMWYGDIQFSMVGNVFDLLPYMISDYEVIHSDYPQTFESISFYFGMVLYETTIRAKGSVLDLTKRVHDRGYVFVNRNRLVQIVQRPHNNKTIQVDLNVGDTLQILVENQGRICYGTNINDTKGLIGNITLDGKVLQKWAMSPLKIDRIVKRFASSKRSLDDFTQKIRLRKSRQPAVEADGFIPTLYTAGFYAAPKPGDTYLDMGGWGRGFAFATNGYNLGRYWPDQGPQIALYHPFVNAGNNKVSIFEMEKPAAAAPGTAAPRRARLVNYPVYTGGHSQKQDVHFNFSLKESGLSQN